MCFIDPKLFFVFDFQNLDQNILMPEYFFVIRNLSLDNDPSSLMKIFPTESIPEKFRPVRLIETLRGTTK